MTACSWFFWRLVRPIQAKSLVLYAGDNDLGDGKSPIEVVHQFGFLRSQIDQFLGLIPFAFLSIKPSPARWHLKERIQETNSAIEKEITARPQGLYIDVFQPMLDAEGNPRRELFSEDGLHLSAAGYRLWREILWRYGNLLF
jgi:lysophospholipase L1-like esterase